MLAQGGVGGGLGFGVHTVSCSRLASRMRGLLGSGRTGLFRLSLSGLRAFGICFEIAVCAAPDDMSVKEDRNMIFRDREDAARRLAEALVQYRGQNPLVLAIPRGAVPMAKIITET